MNLEVGKYYSVEIKRRGRFLEYNVKILSNENGEIIVKTEDGERLPFSNYEIIKSREIPSFEKKKDFVFRTKRAKVLGKVEEPEM